MTALIFISSAAASIIMIGITIRYPFMCKVFNGLAFFSLLTAGSILSVTVMNVLRQKEVFMTTVHEVLLSPLFLLSIGYAGLYAAYVTGLCFIRSQTGKHSID